MSVTVTKLTDIDLMRKACEYTLHGKKSNLTLNQIYKCQHSPIRTQIFTVELRDVPTFVSVHFARHTVGVTHFVTSNREDRGGTGEENRWTPVNHLMFINAEALINLARKRLCSKSHIETTIWMREICEGVKQVDLELYPYLIPECEYRNFCPELKSCGRYSG